MKIPVKEVLLLSGSSNFKAVEKPSPIIMRPYSLDEAMAGVPQPERPPDPVDRSVKQDDFCCKRMSEHYGGNSIFSIGTKLGKPVVIMVHQYEEYRELTSDDIPIDYCPFCGQGLDAVIVESVKQVCRDVVTQVSVFEEEPLS